MRDDPDTEEVNQFQGEFRISKLLDLQLIQQEMSQLNIYSEFRISKLCDLHLIPNTDEVNQHQGEFRISKLFDLHLIRIHI